MSRTADRGGGLAVIIAWVGLVVVAVLVVMAVPASSSISAVTWPEDAPLNLHDNRALDPHLRHLARILSSDSTTEAQRIVGDLVEGLVQSPAVTLVASSESARARLGASVAGFVSDQPARDHDQFLRRLGEALDRIERL